MAKTLNGTIVEMKPDKLIYDSKHPVDGKVVKISVSEAGAAEEGTLKRGQILDLGADGYSVHAANGVPDVILAEDVSYGTGATDVYGQAYISGSFLQTACVTDVELTEADVQTLRGKGIYLK